MPKYPYRILGYFFDRLFRNDINDNFKDIETDLKDVQTQINQLVVEGDSSPQAALASVDAKGVIKGTLKQRLDDDYNELSSNMAQKSSQTDMNTTNENVALKANQIDLNAQKSRIDNLVATANTSFYQKSTSGTTGALLVVSSGATTGQINLASVTPVATGYAPVAGDYVLLVYGVAGGSAELIDARVTPDGAIYANAGESIREQFKFINADQIAFAKQNVLYRSSINRKTLADTNAWNDKTLVVNYPIIIAENTAFVFKATDYNVYGVQLASIKFYNSSDALISTKIVGRSEFATKKFTYTTPAGTVKMTLSLYGISDKEAYTPQPQVGNIIFWKNVVVYTGKITLDDDVSMPVLEKQISSVSLQVVNADQTSFMKQNVLYNLKYSEVVLTSTNDYAHVFPLVTINIAGNMEFTFMATDFNVYGEQLASIKFYDASNVLISTKIIGRVVEFVNKKYKYTTPAGTVKMTVTLYGSSNTAGYNPQIGNIAYWKNVVIYTGKITFVDDVDVSDSSARNDITTIKNTLSSLSDTSTINNLFKLKSMYRYIALTFIHAIDIKDNMIMLGTNDLKNFTLVKQRGFYHTNNSNSVRDPAIIQIGEWYYIMYTAIGWGDGNTIGFCRTKDFVTFEELSNLPVLANNFGTEVFKTVWAPAWFRDDNDIYIISSCTRTSNPSSYLCVINKYDVKNHTLGSGTIINVGGYIDAHIYKENGYYYACNGGTQIWKSSSLFGTYTLITNNNMPSGHYEANYCVKMDNGKWRMYIQEVNDGTTTLSSHMCYIDADALDGTWSAIKQVKYDPDTLSYSKQFTGQSVAEYWHWTIFDFNNVAGNNNNFN
jgi:hypothetical protein